MKMKTYQADTMQEVLQRIKEELGPEAIILKSKKVQKKNLGKIWEMIEVTAGLEESLYAKPPMPEKPQTPPSTYDWRGSLRRFDSNGQPMDKKIEPILNTKANNVKPDTEMAKWLETMKTEFKEVRQSVELPTRELKMLRDEIKNMVTAVDLLRPARESASVIAPESLGAFQTVLDSLLEMDIDKDLALALIDKLASVLPPWQGKNLEKCHELLIKFMAQQIPVLPLNAYTGAQDGTALNGASNLSKHNLKTPYKIMLVGPTGVGKTTTLIKLAVQLRFEKGKKVGILSADAYRMGAAEQLKVFAHSAGIPMLTLFNDEDIIQGLRKLKDCEYILIDTGGRGPAHKDLLQDLQNLIQKTQPHEIHLTLCAHTRGKELARTIEDFRPLGTSRLIFTKLDECISLGNLYNLTVHSKIPVSYVCNGQDLSAHLKKAEPETFSSVLFMENMVATQWATSTIN